MTLVPTESRYSAIMVVVDSDMNERYVGVEIDDDDIPFPENHPRDIMRLVNYCNNYIHIDGIKFIDVSAIVRNGIVTQWESM